MMEREQVKILARKSADDMVKAIPRTNWNDHYTAYIQGYEASEEQMRPSGDIHNVSDIVYYDHIQPDEFISDGEKYNIVEVVSDGYILENEKTRKFWASDAQIASCS